MGDKPIEPAQGERAHDAAVEGSYDLSARLAELDVVVAWGALDTASTIPLR